MFFTASGKVLRYIHSITKGKKFSYHQLTHTEYRTRASQVAQCKESACQCRTPGFHFWVEKIPGEGNGKLQQYSYLQKSMDRGAWQATVQTVIYDWVAEHAAAAKLLQSCPTLCDPIDGSPLGSPVPGILQARTLEWVAIAFFECQLWARQYGVTARYENCPIWKWWSQDSNSYQLGLEFMLLDGDREKQWV